VSLTARRISVYGRTFGPGASVSAYAERLYDPPPEFGHRPVDGGVGWKVDWEACVVRPCAWVVVTPWLDVESSTIGRYSNASVTS
jgi:hypothetical protein